MPDSGSQSGSTPPLWHIFSKQSTPGQGNHISRQPIAVDRGYYANLTDELLDSFYPKFCCKERLTTRHGQRETVLRCPHCHKQQSSLAGTPLYHLKVPRWMFAYLLKEAQLQYPKVLTITEISKRVGVSMPTALKLKRRLQLFAAETMPRMQRKFYEDNKLQFAGFRFPKDRNADLADMVKDKPVPQADTVVLYSCGTLANKGRKRYKRTGQTSSIYLSESLGGKQVGTLVNTTAIKGGPVFYDSIPNQKAEVVNKIVFKYVPVHNPIFTDMGYSLPSMNHRTVNHARKSTDKRYRWARNRWSKNGVHCNVAEGRNGALKRSFASYVWINPKHSNLYLQEYAFNANLRHYSLEDLLPPESKPDASPGYELDWNWRLGGMLQNLMHTKSGPLRTRLEPLVYEALSLPEIIQSERKSKDAKLEQKLAQIEYRELANKLRQEHDTYKAWIKSKPTRDERRQQRYYEGLAEKLWPAIPTHSFMELHDLCAKFKLTGKHVFRLFGIWTRLGLLDSVDLNRKTKGKELEYFDIRRTVEILLPVRYTIPKAEIPQFNLEWRAALRGIK